MSDHQPRRSRLAAMPADSDEHAQRVAAAIELARRAASGNARATRRLLEIVGPRVVRATCAVMGRNHPDLDDAVQLALIGFVQALPSFRGECHPAQFAARIAVRSAGAVRRRFRSRTTNLDTTADLDSIEGSSSELADARLRAVVRGLLDELPEEQAESLALRVALGWSLKEIAAAMGAPVNTVRNRLRVAKEALRQRIAADPEMARELNMLESDV
jgi:RNA polymerase sigma-70 factor (ECF subfamily)